MNKVKVLNVEKDSIILEIQINWAQLRIDNIKKKEQKNLFFIYGDFYF